MLFKLFARCAVLIAALCTLSQHANAVVVDANHSITVTYDYTGILSGPYTELLVEIDGFFLGASNIAPYSPFFSAYNAEAFDSLNNLLFSTSNGSFPAPLSIQQTLTGSGFIPGISDPSGYIVISSNGGSIIDVTQVTVFASNDPCRCSFGTPMDVTGSLVVNSIAAVPEPSTWAMMIFGFAGVGFMAYRRMSKPSFMAT